MHERPAEVVGYGQLRSAVGKLVAQPQHRLDRCASVVGNRDRVQEHIRNQCSCGSEGFGAAGVGGPVAEAFRNDRLTPCLAEQLGLFGVKQLGTYACLRGAPRSDSLFEPSPVQRRFEARLDERAGVGRRAPCVNPTRNRSGQAVDG